MFLNPVDNDEFISLTKLIKSSISCGPNSILSNILKNHIKNLSTTLELIINNYLDEVVFPKLMN